MLPTHGQLEYSHFEEWDKEIETRIRARHSDAIKCFEKGIELATTLFDSAQRVTPVADIDAIQLAAVRLVMDSRAAFRLALQGFFPQSAALCRNSLESLFLITDFIENPSHEGIWFDGGKRKREKLFKASSVRNRLKESGVMEMEIPIKLYDELSKNTIHANVEASLWNVGSNEDGTHSYHYTGQDKPAQSAFALVSVLSILVAALTTLSKKDFIAFQKIGWVKEYSDWRKDVAKSLTNLAVIAGVKDVTSLTPKTIKLVFGDK